MSLQGPTFTPFTYNQLMTLTNTQIRSLAADHAWRVVDSMDTRTLMRYAAESIAESFDLDVNGLVDDIVNHEGGDLESAWEFMSGSGIPDEELKELLPEVVDG